MLETITGDEAAPCLMMISYRIPDIRSTVKLGVQCLHDYAGFNTSVGLTADPIANFSGVIGNSVAALGTDVSIDTKTGNFLKYNAGLSLTDADLIASLAVNEKANQLKTSYYHLLSPLTNSAVGAELTHNFSTKENTITVGTQHSLGPLTTIKAGADNAGKIHALIQHEWHPKCGFTISGEVDTKAVDKTVKIGLAVALKL
nr:PREDICTED: mitochondrial outer membrane protein porin of 34 kDa-like [Daucus carota subsp. sativus]